MLSRYMADDDLRIDAASAVTIERDSVPDEKEKEQFAALESTLLLHQAAETLLRLLLAHWEDAPCPWAEMARLRQPGKFPRAVSDLAASLERDDGIQEAMRVVSFSGDQADVEAHVTWKAERGWDRHRDGLRSLIEYCAKIVREEADLYNAGKHGLAVTPSEKGVELGEGDLISVHGPSLTVIARTMQDQEPRWTKVVYWVNYKQAIVLAGLIARAIRSMWACGKQRRLSNGDMTHLRFFDVDEFNEVMRFNSTASGFVVRSMSEVLFDLAHPMFTPEPDGSA